MKKVFFSHYPKPRADGLSGNGEPAADGDPHRRSVAAGGALADDGQLRPAVVASGQFPLLHAGHAAG